MIKISSKKQRFLNGQSKKLHKSQLKRVRKKHFLKSANIKSKVKFPKSPNKRFGVKPKYIEVKAPKNFSIIDNTEQVIDFFNSAQSNFSKNENVFFDLSEVESMGLETLTLYCAKINDFDYLNGSSFMGNLPSNKKLQQIFEKAGFFNHVYTFNKKLRSKLGKINNELISRLVNEKVEEELAAKICSEAVQHTFGNDKKYRPIYTPIVECMDNTFDHASTGINGNLYKWWLLVYKEPNTKITKFCFLDLGVGIFGSLNHYLMQKMVKYFRPHENIHNLKEIFKGNYKTRTKNRVRGRGLPHIYEAVKTSKNIKNFTLISNDVLFKINNGDEIYSKISNDFRGTLYYWELVPNE